MVRGTGRWESTQILAPQLNISKIQPYIHLTENVRINLISDNFGRQGRIIKFSYGLSILLRFYLSSGKPFFSHSCPSQPSSPPIKIVCKLYSKHLVELYFFANIHTRIYSYAQILLLVYMSQELNIRGKRKLHPFDMVNKRKFLLAWNLNMKRRL